MAVRAEHGRLTPDVIVKAARPAKHPLHSRFEWNDGIAAEAHRQAQAQELIRRVRIRQLPEGEGPIIDVRAFHAVYTEEQGHVYEPAEDVAANPLWRAMVLRDMRREWLAMKSRYEAFDEFWKLVTDELAEAI